MSRQSISWSAIATILATCRGIYPATGRRARGDEPDPLRSRFTLLGLQTRDPTCGLSTNDERRTVAFYPLMNVVSQSQNDPLVGSSAKSLPSWQRYSGTPERTICFIRIRVSDMALVLQSQGIGTIASKASF